jgi:membrane protease YdiL (CAAX protease family)
MAGNRYGLVISALIFTGAHLLTYGNMLDLLDVFLAGLILGYAYMLTKSIYLPAVYHFMWDFLQINIFRLQDYEFYKGPVLVLFNNTEDLIINNLNLGNKLEVVFIIVEIMILVLMHTYRKKLQKLAA